jgi:hypothetical protein
MLIEVFLCGSKTVHFTVGSSSTISAPNGSTTTVDEIDLTGNFSRNGLTLTRSDGGIETLTFSGTSETNQRICNRAVVLLPQ